MHVFDKPLDKFFYWVYSHVRGMCFGQYAIIIYLDQEPPSLSDHASNIYHPPVHIQTSVAINIIFFLLNGGRGGLATAGSGNTFTY